MQNSEKNIKNQITRLDITTKDQLFNFIGQKAEKLTIAVYLITDFLNPKESFRWKIRDQALSFLSLIHSLLTVMSVSEKERTISQALSLLSDTTSLLRFGLSVRFISQMNYSILKDEYMSLYNVLEAQLFTNKPHDNLFLPQNFFEISERDSKGHMMRIEDKGQNEEKNVFYSVFNKPSQKDREITMETNDSFPSEADSSWEKKIVSGNNSFINAKEIRQKTILNLLRTRGNISIKDISEVVQGCSEKTIQRELSSLISQRLVQKTGERRWSKYALATLGTSDEKAQIPEIKT